MESYRFSGIIFSFLFVILTFSITFSEASEERNRHVQYRNLKIYDYKGDLIGHQIEGTPYFENGSGRMYIDRNNPYSPDGRMYEFRNIVYSLDDGGYIIGTELIETNLEILSYTEMWNYQRELGFKESEIEEMLNPTYLTSKPRLIDPEWYAVLTEETKSTQFVDAIVMFEEEFPFHIPIPPPFSVPEVEDFNLLVQAERTDAIEERMTAMEEVQEPYIEQLDVGAIVVDQFWIINGLHVRFPAEEIDSILAIEGIRSIEPDRYLKLASLSGEVDSNGIPYKTLLDNNRTLGINLY